MDQSVYSNAYAAEETYGKDFLHYGKKLFR